MLIGCPNCGTNFSVPDSALGAKGRTLKCAKCGHKWFQAPIVAEGEFGLDDLPQAPRRSAPPPPKPESRPRPAPEPMQEPVRDPAPMPDFMAEPPNAAAAAAARAAAAFDLNLDLDDAPSMAGGADHGMHQPLPESLTRPAQPRRKGGTTGLWLLLLLLLLVCAGAAGYYFQDRVVQMWPPADGILMDMGLRHEKPGAGLELRNAGTPERMVYNDVDMLIVRGVIANISDHTRMVPPMKLMLLDKDKHVVQEKIDQPPVTSLDPGGTASFKIQLQRPDANAVEVNVIFVDPAQAEGK